MKRLISLALVLMSVLSLGITAIAKSSSTYTDIPPIGDYSREPLISAIENDIMQGNGSTLITPKSVMTNAEGWAYMVNALSAETRVSTSSITDAPSGKWYTDQGYIAKALGADLITPANGRVNPEKQMTREDSFILMARAVSAELDESDNAFSILSKFTDTNSISSANARNAIAALVKLGYVKGSPLTDGKYALNPASLITRAEYATLFHNVFNRYISQAGTYSTLENGNVIIRASGVTLRNVNVNGDLIIADGVGNGDVTLDNVTVYGRTIIRGGGANSIRAINGSRLNTVYINNNSREVRLAADSKSIIGTVNALTDAYIDGNVNILNIRGTEKIVRIISGTVRELNIPGDASNNTVNIASGAMVTGAVVNSDGNAVGGTGTLKAISLRGNYNAVGVANAVVTAGSGTKGNIADGTAIAAGMSVTTKYTLSVTAGNSSNSLTFNVVAVEVTSDTTITVTFDANITSATIDNFILSGTALDYSSKNPTGVSVSGRIVTLTFRNARFDSIPSGGTAAITVSGVTISGGGVLLTNEKTWTKTGSVTWYADPNRTASSMLTFTRDWANLGKYRTSEKYLTLYFNALAANQTIKCESYNNDPSYIASDRTTFTVDSMQIDISDLPSGYYYIMATSYVGITATESYLFEFEIQCDTVILTSDSLGKAGSGRITGLTAGRYYAVFVKGEWYAIQNNMLGQRLGTTMPKKDSLSPINGTSILGLENGEIYTVAEIK